MRVVFLPDLSIYQGNPYWTELASALQKLDVEFVTPGDPLYLQWRWLLANRHKVDVIHLHFLQHHYAEIERRAAFLRLFRYILKLALARLLGYRLVWTVHNLYPHERTGSRIVEHLAHWVTAQLAHVLIVHCEYAREAVAKAFHRRRNVLVVPHPSYVGVYPNGATKEQARKQLGIDQENFVLLFLGSIRPYKGIEHLCDVVHSIPDQNLILILAGKPSGGMDEEALREMVQNDNRIRLTPKTIPDQELQWYFAAADAAVFPFVDVLSSGSVALSMSFGCPPVAPRIGCVGEMIGEDAGILYDPSAPNGLRNALLALRESDLDRFRMNAIRFAANRTWDDMAHRTLDEAYARD